MPIIAAKKAESLYDDEEEMPQHAPKESNPEGTEGMLSAVIPTAVLKGKPFEVGDSVVLRIDSIQGDQIVVSYAEPSEDETTDEMDELDEDESDDGAGNTAMPPEGAPTMMASEAGDGMYD